MDLLRLPNWSVIAETETNASYRPPLTLTNLLLRQTLLRQELVTEGEAARSYVELSDSRIMRTPASLEHRHCPLDLRISTEELEKHDVVREMGDSELGQPG